jgi:hypothetical protein
MTAKYRVLLPIDVDGKIFQYDQVVELDAETAKQYAHALVRVPAAEEEEAK